MSKQPNGWTDSEVEILLHNYGKVSSEMMRELIPARTWKAIKARGCLHGLSTPRADLWTEEQTAILREHYPTLGAEAVSKMIGRPTSSVWHRAADLKIKIICKTCAAGGRKKTGPKQKPGPKPRPKVGQTTITIKSSPLIGDPIITSQTKVTIAPPFVDRRWIADSVRRVIDSSQCRDWAANA